MPGGTIVFFEKDGRLVYRYDAETLWIEPWGEDALRIRSTTEQTMVSGDRALTETAGHTARIDLQKEKAVISNGKIRAELSKDGKLIFFNSKGEILLEEYVRNNRNLQVEHCSSMGIEAREFRGIPGGDYEVSVWFESNPSEKLFGMGQYQQSCLNLKGCQLELAQRNAQISIPFVISSLGYGFLWNNPAIGEVTFGMNRTTWKSRSAKIIDYWIVAGDTPAQIEERYAKAVGTAPAFPDYALGYWQCKLRYQTQEEVLQVAKEYKRRGIPLSVLVIDYFHWPKQGEWKFDPVYWPDPDAMVKELHEMGIEVMVSVWPTVDIDSENYEEMLEKGYLIRTDRGLRFAMHFHGDVIHYDATNPNAREYVWDKARKNYYDKGIRMFWLDEAEPEYSTHDFDLYRYHAGSNLQIGNSYPLFYAKGFYEGMRRAGQTEIVNLIRSAWVGSQKYGALVWSGDIYSSFASMKNQIAAGMNIGLAGIPWWTTDIGGFHGGDPESEDFRELLVRWFQFGAFLPVMRMHGDRLPKQPQLGTTGGCECLSGAPNEVWSFGEEVYRICCRYIHIRERLRPYLKELMQEASDKGTPLMRPLFYEFPDDENAWNPADQYLLGSDLLVAPVCEKGAVSRSVYLPSGCKWVGVWDQSVTEGGRTLEVSCPLDVIPLFVRQGSGTSDKIKWILENGMSLFSKR